MNGLVVQQTQSRGLGVFSTIRFEKGDLIECSRVILMDRKEFSLFASLVLRNYVVDWDKQLALPTGYGPFYNHSYQPNAIIAKYFDLEEIHFIALKDILPYDEITFNYGGFPNCADPMWFEVKEL
jgi:uncharacterized protein